MLSVSWNYKKVINFLKTFYQYYGLLTYCDQICCGDRIKQSNVAAINKITFYWKLSPDLTKTLLISQCGTKIQFVFVFLISEIREFLENTGFRVNSGGPPDPLSMLIPKPDTVLRVTAVRAEKSEGSTDRSDTYRQERTDRKTDRWLERDKRRHEQKDRQKERLAGTDEHLITFILGSNKETDTERRMDMDRQTGRQTGS